MARSQILKDVVSGKESIENILLRLKVILSDLDNELIMKWVDGELQGYKSEDDLPKYRIFRGSIIGTYLVNYQAKYTNAPVPLEVLLPQEKIDNISIVTVNDSIATVQNMLDGENRERFAKVIPTAFCHAISTSQLQIVGMNVHLSSNHLDGIVSSVKHKLIEIVMQLEKQFDNLDELDIKSQVEEDSSKRDQIVYDIENIIYEGSPISIGDKNKINKSKLGHIFGRKDQV
ncbi:AbiTii domain-containing protein [Priestia aryabhattai]